MIKKTELSLATSEFCTVYFWHLGDCLKFMYLAFICIILFLTRSVLHPTPPSRIGTLNLNLIN